MLAAFFKQISQRITQLLPTFQPVPQHFPQVRVADIFVIIILLMRKAGRSRRKQGWSKHQWGNQEKCTEGS